MLSGPREITKDATVTEMVHMANSTLSAKHHVCIWKRTAREPTRSGFTVDNVGSEWLQRLPPRQIKSVQDADGA
jgi:hypothetical protein